MNYLDEFKPFREHPVLICQYMANISSVIQNFAGDYIGNIHQLLYSIRAQVPLRNILYFRKPEGFQFRNGFEPEYFTAASDKLQQNKNYIKGSIELHNNLGDINVNPGSVVIPSDNENLLKKAPSFKKCVDEVECYIFTPIFAKHRIVSCLLTVVEKQDLKNIPKDMIPSLAAFYDIVSGFFSMQESALLIENELKQKIEFEELVTKLATQHASCPNANIDNVINTTILELCNFSKANYGFIYLFEDDQKTLIRTNCVSNGFIIRERVKVSADGNPWKWFIETIKKNGVVNCLRKCEIPKIEMCHSDITSIIIIPVICLSEKINSIKGFIGIASVDKNVFASNQQLIEKLQIVGALLTSAIKRRYTYEANLQVQDYLTEQLVHWKQQTKQRRNNLEELRKQLIENKLILETSYSDNNPTINGNC